MSTERDIITGRKLKGTNPLNKQKTSKFNKCKQKIYRYQPLFEIEKYMLSELSEEMD